MIPSSSRLNVPGGCFRTGKARRRGQRGFALVVTVSLMVLITIVAVGMLSLASVELRKLAAGDARMVAMANARLGMMLALGELQKQVGDDRRITADASVFAATKNPNAVGVWSGWSPDLASRSNVATTARVPYLPPKSQAGFRGWLVSDPDPLRTALLEFHTAESTGDARLFTEESSGYELAARRVPLAGAGQSGSMAWAVSQQNTRAKVNIGVDEDRRELAEDQMQAPSRPNLALSETLKQPTRDWASRPATVLTTGQLALDPAYGVSRERAGRAARDFTVDAKSLLTDVVKGGLKVDLMTAFEMPEGDFIAATWQDAVGTVKNPLRGNGSREYKGQSSLFRPIHPTAQAQVYMNFHPASVNHKFQVNGVPTFETLRSHYRIHRHLYQGGAGSGSEPTAFERPHAHIATPELVAGRPFGNKSQPSLAPVLDRMNLFFSIYAKRDGTLGILLTPVVTIWNPHNIAVETEGLVVYPWIDFAVFWNWRVRTSAGGLQTWNSSLSRFVGEGFEGHGRSSRPYFYLHLTQNGAPVPSGTRTITPPIRLEPGEVRVFAMADGDRRDLEIYGSPQQRTWRMKPVTGLSDLTSAMRGGIVLNMTKSINGGSNFNYKLQRGDQLESASVGFDRGTYYYIVNMADAYHIRNPGVELMVEARAAGSGLPALPAEKNLYFYSQIHAGRSAQNQPQDTITYPPFRFEEINETPKLVGSLLTYHRVAESGSLPLSDLMFTTNPRQAFVNPYLSDTTFQTGPHYESVLRQGTSLAQLTMETTLDGQRAYYGPSHSAATGRSTLAFFEVPRTPTLSLAAFQHCDISTTPFAPAAQIGNSWASPYLPAANISKTVASSKIGGTAINPGLAVYDWSYLANEALFDGFYLSGAAPEFGQRQSASGSPAVWETSQITETKPVGEVLQAFFTNPAAKPLRNPRMMPYRGSHSDAELTARLAGPARCVRLAAHLMVDGGFNINSTSEEAWTAVLASLRGIAPAAGDMTSFSRFRHVLKDGPGAMVENDPWSGFRTLSDGDLKTLAKNIVAEVKLRGPFLSLGEFVNRQIGTTVALNSVGALQSAIDKTDLNRKYSYSRFTTERYPNPENVRNPNTGTGTPGWLTQADLLHGLAPFITPRSDTFIVRSLGEAKDATGKVLATVRLEAVVQRVADWVDPVDDPATAVAALSSPVNQTFGRRMQVVSVREL